MEVKDIKLNDARTNLKNKLYLKLPLLNEPFVEQLENWVMKWDGGTLYIIYSDKIVGIVSYKEQCLFELNPHEPLLNKLISNL